MKGILESRKKALTHLVDNRSGSLIPVDRSTPLFEPVYETMDPNDPNGDWKARDGSRIPRYGADTNELFKRVPVWDDKSDPDNPQFKVESRSWNSIVNQAREWNKNEKNPDEHKTPEQIWYRIHLENNILRTKGQSNYYIEAYNYERQRGIFDSSSNVLDKIGNNQPLSREDVDSFINNTLPENERADFRSRLGQDRSILWRDANSAKTRSESTLRFIEEIAGSSQADIERNQKLIDSAIPIENYSAGKAADTVSRAAIYAMDREKRPSKEGVWGWDVRQGDKFEKPLFIAIENFFPDMNGGHPDEIKRMVKESRRTMVDQLKNRGVSEEQAKKQAADRIKATWDTSHANMWRKYFKANDGESIEKTDARFKEWYLKKAKEWVNEDIIGHVHVSDNFGWEDEHVVPGQGNAPIKEFIQEIKQKADKGEIDVIVEPSHNDYRAMLGGWKLFGSSIYGAQAGARDGWTEVERGYFGRNAPPYFLYGDAAPDPESWMLWSGTRME